MGKTTSYTPSFLELTNLDYRHTNAGCYMIAVMYKGDMLGVFVTNSMALIDDIHELNGGGEEEDLRDFLTFNDLKQHCLNKINF